MTVKLDRVYPKILGGKVDELQIIWKNLENTKDACFLIICQAVIGLNSTSLGSPYNFNTLQNSTSLEIKHNPQPRALQFPEPSNYIYDIS